MRGKQIGAVAGGSHFIVYLVENIEWQDKRFTPTSLFQSLNKLLAVLTDIMVFCLTIC